MAKINEYVGPIAELEVRTSSAPAVSGGGIKSFQTSILLKRYNVSV